MTKTQRIIAAFNEKIAKYQPVIDTEEQLRVLVFTVKLNEAGIVRMTDLTTSVGK